MNKEDESERENKFDLIKFKNKFENMEVIPVEKQEKYVKEGFWKKTKKVAAKVPFVLDTVTIYYCSIDQKTPLWAKGVAFAALAYFINPVDAIPDSIPVLGFTDDAGAIAAALTALGKNINDKHKDQARQSMLGERYIEDED